MHEKDLYSQKTSIIYHNFYEYIIIIFINSLFQIGWIQVALQVLQSNLNQLKKFT